MAVGHLLRVSSFNYAPYHVITEEGFNAPVKGICGEILAAITRSLKTNYTITFPLDSFWGLLKPDGNWTGVLGMVQRDEADLALSVINPTSEKKDVAVESETILPIEIMILAGRQSRHESNILGIIQIFPWEVWLLAFCGFIMSAIAWSVGDYVHFRLVDKNGPFDHVGNLFGRLWAFVESTFLEAVVNICEHELTLLPAMGTSSAASPVLPSRTSARILVGGYWLVVIILTTAFAGQMKAMLMVRQEADRIDSIKDLSERPTMKPYAPAGSAVVSSIRYSRDPYYQKVWGMMQKFKTDLPPAVVLSDSSMREIIRGKAVLILSRPTLADRANEVCANSSEGEFYVGRVPTFKFNSVFYLNKRMPATLRDFINKRILWLRDSGLLEKWWRESSGNWEGCGQATSDGTLTFADFSDLIKLLLAMLTCAFVVCLAEVAIGRGLRPPKVRQ
ncbi:glutamate receptor ionotropic, kainate glr-3-like [Dermacentor silvarum]|uniref:glutamate receptor ionotropic, kainate glr-3-like n=1 Tax=Dermacentor silvarum TaxID=543639 RepID=UPI0021011A07|nr:glutamate receptor ionotropic, kainate glr-3-like [Dermacentor silvarum]